MRNVIGRKVTRLYVCRYHWGWFDASTRRRTVEAFDEGGPSASQPPCDLAHPCRIWPGRDFFVASVCDAEADWPKNWAVNRAKVGH